MARMDMLNPAIEKLQKDLLLALVEPILLPNVENHSCQIQVSEGSIRVEPDPSAATVPQLLDRLSGFLGFLRQRLPHSVLDPFSDLLIPSLSTKFISYWLSFAIPTELTRLAEFESILDCVLKFAQTIESLGWRGQEELVSWVNQAPRLWLARRRADSLDQVRKVLAASQGSTKQVERIEKEQVSQADEALLENATNDDWDASWDDENGNVPEETPLSNEEEDEDVSAWGLDDDTKEDTSNTEAQTLASAIEDDAEAWGWGDDEDGDESIENPQNQSMDKSKPARSEGVTSHAPREVTLTERYTITDIPESILAIVRQQVTDSTAISQPG